MGNSSVPKRTLKEPMPKRVIATREAYEAEAEQMRERIHPSLRDGFIYMPSDVMLPDYVEKEILDIVFPLECRPWFFKELLGLLRDSGHGIQSLKCNSDNELQEH
jgi:hypothetical protein